MKRTDRFTAFDLEFAAKIVYELEFPPVSLTKRGTTIFRVRGIKPGMVPTAVTLRYPQYSSLNKRDLLDQWGDAKFRLRIASIGSGKAFTHTFDLAETNWGYDAAISDRAHFTVPLTGYLLNKKFRAEEWSRVTDYDIEVTVLEPTRYGSHQVELTGFFPVFFGEHEINGAQQAAPDRPPPAPLSR